MADVGEQHFEEWYIQHIYTLFIWVIFSGPEETNVCCGKMMHIRTMVLSSTVLTTLSCKLIKSEICGIQWTIMACIFITSTHCSIFIKVENVSANSLNSMPQTYPNSVQKKIKD